MEKTMKLQGKVAIVTGAGAGIGMGIAIGFAQEGANVVVNYAHSAAGAEKVAEEIIKLGQKAIPFKASVSNQEEVQAMVDCAVREFGRVDVLVNNAGIDPHIKFLEMTEDQWDWIIDTNLKGNYFCSQAAARQMVKQGEGGRIIIISSVHSIQTYMHITAYATTKGGLTSMTRQLALELAPFHITVNCVAPGAVHVDKFYGVIPNYDPHMFDHEIPVGFIGYPEDVAAACSYFASPEARYTTGQTLYVDGGTTCRLTLGVSEKKVDSHLDVKTLAKKD
jgi:NAD(P)-dependent dehydrogenase (short-subunit alcohol dehydrogenase family)